MATERNIAIGATVGAGALAIAAFAFGATLEATPDEPRALACGPVGLGVSCRGRF